MEIETILEGTPPFKDFKGNAVQDILEDSEHVEHQESIVVRLQPQHLLGQGNVSYLTDNLILCSASSVNSNTLDALNVSCVVNVAPELPDTPLYSNDIVYYKISVIDSGSSRILPYFDDAADLIQRVANSDGKTLVYCVAGVSRSASICLAYLMKYFNFTLLEAYNYVKLRRPKIRPNCGFFKQLIEYEKILFDCNSVRMVFNEMVQMEIPDVYDSEYQQIRRFKKVRNENGRH